MKKYLSGKSLLLAVVVTLCLVPVFLSACGKKHSQADVSMYDLYQAMCLNSGNTFSGMKYASSSDTCPEELFRNISEMDYGKVEDFFICYAADGTGNADEVAVIHVKDRKDVSEAKASLEKHLEYRKSLYRTYDPSQSEKLEHAVTAVNGSTAALIVAEHPKAVEKAFRSYFEGK